MIITLDFILKQKGCDEGREWCINNGMIGLEYNAGIRHAIAANRSDIAAWFIEQKKSELYVRLNGSTCTMIYDVYSPFDGTHTRVVTEEEAKAASAKIAEEVIKKLHRPVVSKVLVNDVGDETFMGEDPTIVESLTIK